MKTYYKVVHDDGFRWVSCGRKNRLRSLCVTYKLNVWSEPPIGKLFVFSSLFYAVQYNLAGEDAIFECECINPQYPRFNKIPNLKHTEIKNAADFWKKSECDLYNLLSWDAKSWIIPNGTMICDGVKLIERVR